MHKLFLCLQIILASLFFTTFAFADNEDLVEWARKKNSEFIKKTGYVGLDLEIKCASGSEVVLDDVQIVDGRVIRPRYNLKIHKSIDDVLHIKGTVKAEGHRTKQIWFSGKINDGIFDISGSWNEVDSCNAIGIIRNEEKLPTE